MKSKNKSVTKNTINNSKSNSSFLSGLSATLTSLNNSVKTPAADKSKLGKKEKSKTKEDFSMNSLTIRSMSKSKENGNFSQYDSSGLKLSFIPVKGFNAEKFVKEKTPEDVKCRVCDSLFKNPMACYKCSHKFCDKCIKETIEKFTKCPKCFSFIFYDMLEKVDIEKLDQEKIKKEIKCPFAKCKESYTIFEIKAHLDTCIFRDITEVQKEHTSKIIYKDKNFDPFMKTHLLNYLKWANINIPELKKLIETGNLTNLTAGIEKASTSNASIQNLILPDYNSKSSNIKKSFNVLNDNITQSIVDLAKLTKTTNEKLKNLINTK
jgi:hypothetical protein